MCTAALILIWCVVQVSSGIDPFNAGSIMQAWQRHQQATLAHNSSS